MRGAGPLGVAIVVWFGTSAATAAPWTVVVHPVTARTAEQITVTTVRDPVMPGTCRQWR